MSGCSFGRLALLLALLVVYSSGCAASRSGSCRDGRCKVSSESASEPMRTDTARAKQAQQACPLTGESLGSMGPPISVTVDGRNIHVCCQSCVAEVKKNPKKYAKIVADELAHAPP